jgi:hypothetical protein
MLESFKALQVDLHPTDKERAPFAYARIAQIVGSREGIVVAEAIRAEDGGRVDGAKTDGAHEPVPSKHEVADKPRHSAVSVLKWMQPQEAVVRDCGVHKLLMCRHVTVREVQEVVHFGHEKYVTRRGVVGMRDSDIHTPILPWVWITLPLESSHRRFVKASNQDMGEWDRLIKFIQERHSFLDVADLSELIGRTITVWPRRL